MTRGRLLALALLLAIIFAVLVAVFWPRPEDIASIVEIAAPRA